MSTTFILSDELPPFPLFYQTFVPQSLQPSRDTETALNGNKRTKVDSDGERKQDTAHASATDGNIADAAAAFQHTLSRPLPLLIHPPTLSITELIDPSIFEPLPIEQPPDVSTTSALHTLISSFTQPSDSAALSEALEHLSTVTITANDWTQAFSTVFDKVESLPVSHRLETLLQLIQSLPCESLADAILRTQLSAIMQQLSDQYSSTEGVNTDIGLHSLPPTLTSLLNLCYNHSTVLTCSPAEAQSYIQELQLSGVFAKSVTALLLQLTGVEQDNS